MVTQSQDQHDNELATQVIAACQSAIVRAVAQSSQAIGPTRGLDAALTSLRLVPTRAASLDVFVSRRRAELLKTTNRNFICMINAVPPRRQGTDAPFVRQARDSLRAAVLSAERGTPVQVLMVQAIGELLARSGRRPIA